MNEASEVPETPQTPPSTPGNELIRPSPSAGGRPLSYWVRRFCACNPFYLVSAALLLYGFHRISVDSNFLREEIAQLNFNFTSLECYELLLVLTAIFLARRRIWYDSTLLVSLENLLVLVPFILISQAALIDKGKVWGLSLTGGIIAIVRFGGLKRFIAELNFPVRLLSVGSAVLMVNVGSPVVYRLLHESKVGTKPDWGPAYYANEFIWLLLVPLLCGMANLLAAAKSKGKLPPQSRWLPLGLFALWIVATGVHLYCLGYVYDFPLRAELTAPAVWILLWTLRQRARDFLPAISYIEEKVFLIPPLLATLLAASQPSKEVFLALTILNLAIYGAIYLHQRQERFALHLFFLSLVALIGGLPEDWGRNLVTEFSRTKCVGAGLAGYFLLLVPFSRNPKLGILGALVSATLAIFVLGRHAYTGHWALEIGLVFLLLHSLRWVDREHTGASAVRALAACAWVAHAVIWIHTTGAPWMTWAVAAPVLCACFGARLFGGTWGPRIVPIAALLVLLSGPGNFTAIKVQSIPVGLLAVAGSFMLFAVGTIVAMTKHRWNKTEGLQR